MPYELHLTDREDLIATVSVAYDAIDTITNLKTIIFDLLNMPDFDGTKAVAEARRATKRAARAAIQETAP